MRVVMRFSIYDEARARTFASRLRELGLPGTTREARGRWIVTTHSGALDYAADLKKYLHGARPEEGRAR